VRFLLRVIINAAALWVAAWLIPGIEISPGAGVDPQWTTAATLGTYLFLGLVFGVVNAVLGAVLRVLSAPLTCLTLGLFALVVNAALLEATAWVAGYFPVTFTVQTFFWDAVLGAIIVSIVSALLNKVLVRERRQD